MRRSILLVLVVALMLTLTAGATASAATATGGEAQVAARARGRRRAARCPTGRRARGRRRAARCRARRPAARRRAAAGGPLADGFYEDDARGVKLTVRGSQAQVSFVTPGDCVVSGALIQGDGTLTTTGSTVTGTGVIAGSALRVDWKLVIAQPRLSYTLETAWLITFPGTSPCVGSDRTAGTLVKQ